MMYENAFRTNQQHEKILDLFVTVDDFSRTVYP